jgi:hypothetical protein
MALFYYVQLFLFNIIEVLMNYVIIYTIYIYKPKLLMTGWKVAENWLKAAGFQPGIRVFSGRNQGVWRNQ